MKKELKRKIVKDLQKAGLGSEMKALKIFQEQGWKSELGRGYFDRDENKTREIDISAYHPDNLKVKGKVCVYNFFHICAEVKKSEKPWIVFSSESHPLFRSCAWNNIIACINLPVAAAKLTDYLRRQSLLGLKGWEGSGIHEAFKDPSSRSRWYSAFIAACKASEDEYENSKSDGPKVSRNILKNSTEFSFHQPVVILDGILATAELSQTGDFVIEEVDSAPFRFDFKTRNYTRDSYRVDLVTLEGLSDYLETVKQRQRDVNDGIKRYAKNVFG
jgi:hypothetical protein